MKEILKKVFGFVVCFILRWFSFVIVMDVTITFYNEFVLNGLSFENPFVSYGYVVFILAFIFTLVEYLVDFTCSKLRGIKHEKK